MEHNWSWDDGAERAGDEGAIMHDHQDVTIADDGDEVGVITAQRLVNELDAAYAGAMEGLAEALDDDAISWEVYSGICAIISDYLHTTRAQLMRIISRD